MDNVGKVAENEALKALGGSVSGGDSISGMLQLILGFVSGTAGQGASSSTTGSLAQNKRQAEFISQIQTATGGNDERIPSILGKMGTAAGGGDERVGEDWKSAFKELPDFLKNILQTAFNQSTVGQLTGGDPRSLSQASVGMLGGLNRFSDPGGLGSSIGGSFSPQRRAVATDINKSLMNEFQDSTTGVPILENTQGQSFENISKFTQTMSQEGGISAKDMIKGMDESGNLEMDEGGLDGAKKNIKKGMELFRNLTDVFGSRDFNELMSQAERLGGLDMSDPSSIGKALTGIKNARGVAQSLGLDERKALGDLTAANDTMVAMGTDRRTAAAFNNAGFAGAMVQGSRNMQQSNPFDDQYRMRLNSSEMMQNVAISNQGILSEGENRPTGEVSISQQLRMFQAKMKEGGGLSTDLDEQITTALEEKDPYKRVQLLRQAQSDVRKETGIDTVQIAKTIGLGKQREMQSADTLADMAGDTRNVLLSRNKEFVRNEFLPMVYDITGARTGVAQELDAQHKQLLQDPETKQLVETRDAKREELKQLRVKRDAMGMDDPARAQMDSQISDMEGEVADISDNNEGVKNVDQNREKRKKVLTALADFEQLIVDSPDFGGIQNLSVLSGIAEGKDGTVEFFDKEKNKRVSKNAKDMSEEQRREAITQNLEARGVAGEEATNLANTIMGIPKALNEARDVTGDSMIDASQGTAYLTELISSNPALAQFLIPDNAMETGIIAGELGAKRLDGAPAMTDPLQNFIFGAMGDNGRALKDKAFKGSESEIQRLDVADIGTNAVQRELFNDLADSTDTDREAISKRAGTRKAMASMMAKIVPALEGISIGEDSNLLLEMLEKEGVEDPEKTLETFKADMAEATELSRSGDPEDKARADKLREKHFDTFQNIMNQVGGGSPGKTPMKLLDTLQSLDAGFRTNKISDEEKQKQIDSIKSGTSIEDIEKIEKHRDSLKTFGDIETQRDKVQTLSDAVQAQKDELGMTPEEAAQQKRDSIEQLTKEDQALINGEESEEVSNARRLLSSTKSDEDKVGARKAVEEYEAKVKVAKEKQASIEAQQAEADELFKPTEELQKARKELADMTTASEGTTKEDSVSKINELMEKTILDDSEDGTTAEGRSKLLEFYKKQSEESGAPLSPTELLEAIEASGDEEMLKTANEVFDTKEQKQITDLEKGSGNTLEIIDGGREEIEQKVEQLRSEEFKSAEKKKELIEGLGLTEFEDVSSDFEAGESVGKTKTQLQDELGKLELDKEGNKDAIAEKKKEIESVEKLESIGGISTEDLFTRDLAGKEGKKEDDLISRLAGGGEQVSDIVDTFGSAGIDPAEMREQLISAKDQFTESFGGKDPTEDQSNRLAEFQKAIDSMKSEVAKDEGTNSLLIDVCDLLKGIFNGKPLNVNIAGK